MRLIDADALDWRSLDGDIDQAKAARQLVESAPIVDAEPVTRGKWIERTTFHSDVVEKLQSARCSNCKKYHTTPHMYYFNHFNYCPWCGAKMEEE